MVWARATLASKLRHHARSQGHLRAAKRLGAIKRKALARAMTLLPGTIYATIDIEYRVGFFSIAWRGHGRLHLPPNSMLPVTMSRVAAEASVSPVVGCFQTRRSY